VGALWTNDNLRPAVSTPLVGFDNYEIYDLVCTNAMRKQDNYLYSSAIQSTAYRNQSIRYVTSVDLVNPLGITDNADKNNPTAAAIFLNYGSQGYYGWLVTENYQATVINTPESLFFLDTSIHKVDPKIYAVQRYTPDGAANTNLIYTLFDQYRPITGSSLINWEQLIINEDIKYTGTAQADGLFTIEYWSNNYLEGHPRIDRTLDYHKLKIRLKKGEIFSFVLYHPVAHSLIAPSQLISALPTTPAPLLTDILAANRNYANTLLVPVLPPSVPPSGYLFKNYSKEFYNPDAFLDSGGQLIGYYPSIAWVAPDNPVYQRNYSVDTYTWIDYRVLRATNQVPVSTWGVDADIGDYPAISPADLNQWHFAPQPDGSNGTIVMDSIRTIQTLELAKKIADAIDAATYATDPATGNPRIANLGHLIEKVANFIGYRPEPNGSIDIQKETTTFAAAVVKADFNSGLDYHAGRFGKKGLLLKRLPNKIGANGKWEPGGMVKVHDLLQLHTELFGQLNQALNLQDSTSITIRDGSSTYDYPNQLALLTEIGTGVIQHRRQIREIWASSIVTQKTVNEVLAGFGLPVVNKSIAINGQQLPYWGIQPSQSLQKEIATSTYQGGAQLGQLL
jgi:hypothetical protein